MSARFQKQRSPHKAGPVSKLGGQAHGKSSVVDYWKLVGAALRDPSLSKGDVSVLLAILDRVGTEGYAWPGYSGIARDTGLDRATVGRAVGKLSTKDYLNKESGGKGKSNRYRPGRRMDAPSSGRRDASSLDDATRRKDATEVGAAVRLQVGAGMRPEPTTLNLPNEPTECARTRRRVSVELPAWLPDDAWKAWKDHRGRKFSSEAQRRAIRKLEALRAEGHDPSKLIDLAIESAWSSFYPRDETLAKSRTVGAVDRDTRSDDEIDRANREQLARFGVSG